MKTAVERFQERVVQMIGDGFRGFHFTAGPKWEGLTAEDRCEFILQMWDAPKVRAEPRQNCHVSAYYRNRMDRLIAEPDYLG